MGKDFLKLKVNSSLGMRILFAAGLMVALLLGICAYRETKLDNGYELQRNSVEEGSYEQELIARLGKTRIPITITVEEQLLSKEEAEAEFLKAEEQLPNLLKGENDSLLNVNTGLNFVNQVPGTCVEVEWTNIQYEYFYSDGRRREDVSLTEPVELTVSAILLCQQYTKDYATVIRILPEEQNTEEKLRTLVSQKQEEHREKTTVVLPDEFEGQQITWSKPLDATFLYFLALVLMAAAAMKFGRKRDEKEAQIQRLEELERDYAQIVSKFSMLLSAGLSIRNAWERIVVMQKRKGELDKLVYQEMNWGLMQMQKGISELEVYERFGMKVKEIHYKKLMALFVSDKRRGSIPLMDAMNQEMMLAWEEQKRKTRQRGEKIGTKLLIPMIGMLGVVFVIILVPALLSFGL